MPPVPPSTMRHASHVTPRRFAPVASPSPLTSGPFSPARSPRLQEHAPSLVISGACFLRPPPPQQVRLTPRLPPCLARAPLADVSKTHNESGSREALASTNLKHVAVKKRASVTIYDTRASVHVDFKTTIIDWEPTFFSLFPFRCNP